MNDRRAFLRDETGTIEVDFTVIVALAFAMGLAVVGILANASGSVNDDLMDAIVDDGVVVQTFSELDRDVIDPFGDRAYTDSLRDLSDADLSSELSGLNASDVAAGKALLDQLYGLSFDGTQTGTVGGIDVSTADSRRALLQKIADDYGTSARQLSEAAKAMLVADEASYRGLTWNGDTGQYE